MINMRKLKNSLAYIWLNAKTAFNALYTYKAASFLNFLTQIILILAQFYLWTSIYSNTTSINGYSFTNMITYLVISFSIDRLYPFNISNKFSQMVKNGEIIHNLLKPIKFEYQLLTDSLGEFVYKLLFTATPIILVGYIFMGIKFSLSINAILIFLLFFISSYLFIFILELFIGVFSYYTQSLWGINNFKTTIIILLSGKLLPLNFYPLFVKNVLYTLPFSTIYFIPINILMKKDISNIYFHFLILWLCIVLLFGFYKIFSSIMIKKIMIQGG